MKKVDGAMTIRGSLARRRATAADAAVMECLEGRVFLSADVPLSDLVEQPAQADVVALTELPEQQVATQMDRTHAGSRSDPFEITVLPAGKK